MSTLPDRLLALREIVGNEYMDETARRRILAWCDEAAAALSGGEAVDCDSCGGTGEIEAAMKINDCETDTTLIGCPDCGGTGTTPQPGDGWVLVQRHWVENVGYAASMLEDSESRIDQLQAPALRKLIAEMAAAPSAKGA